MNIIKYISDKGLKRTFEVIYQYKIDLLFRKIMLIFLKNKPLKDVIIIESHNDFDCNGGAFYNYLIQNGLNKKYKIIWFLKHSCTEKLPYNVEWFKLYGPSVKKAYYILRAKYFLSDCVITNKVREDQRSFYCFHGAVCLKDTKKNYNLPDSVDYILSTASFYEPILAKRIGLEYPCKRFIHVGYPSQDILFTKSDCEIEKITMKKYTKIVLWMPTFRKGGGYNRNDSTLDLPMGVPIINNEELYSDLNKRLKENDVLLIIKIHPMQDLETVKLYDTSNIKILTGESVKELKIDNYRLLKDADAMISDYSSIAYDYLIMNRPIGYVFSDLKEYKCGLCVDDPEEFIAGPIINNYLQFCTFIEDVVNENDNFARKRVNLLHNIYEYTDSKSCERLAEFMGLNNSCEIKY